MTRDHHQPNDHVAWSPPPSSSPMVEHHADNSPGRACAELVSTCSVSCSPTNRTAPWRWTSALVGPAARWRAAGAPAKRRPGLPSNPRASQARANAAPSLPVRPDAVRRPSRQRTAAARRTRCAQRGGPLHRAIPGSSAAQTARLQSRGHRRPVRPDTWVDPVAWTPDVWTPDVRSTDWTDVRTADRGRGQGHDRRGRRPDLLATGDHPLGGQPRRGRSVWAARPPITAPR
jgi:hypothetical protein